MKGNSALTFMDQNEPTPRENLPRATHGDPSRPLRLGDIELPCYVVPVELRVIVQANMLESLDMSRGGAGKNGRDRLAGFVAGRALKPFIPRELSDRIENPIRFTLPRGGVAMGYEATVLTGLCRAVLRARRAGALQKQQLHIAERCEILMDGLADVGIIAMVDLATGYSKDAPANAYEQILERFLAEVPRPWDRRFPEDLYVEVGRLWNLSYTRDSSLRSPFFAKFTADYIYNQLPPGVYEKICDQNPIAYVDGSRRLRHHQFLTNDIGCPFLQQQIQRVLWLLQASRTKREFKDLFHHSIVGGCRQQFLRNFDSEPKRSSGRAQAGGADSIASTN